MNCSDYSTAWVCRTCGSLISLGYEDASLGEVHYGSSDSSPKLTGPSGEYCRLCRSPAEEEEARARKSLSDDSAPPLRQPEVRVALPKSNLLGSYGKGGDLDVVAVPYVFRYLCAELAAMSIAVSLEVR